MMKQKIFSLLLVLIPVFGFSQYLEQDAGEWSGRASFERHTFSGVDGSNSEVIYKIDITFTKGKGSATASYSIDRTVTSKGGHYSESGSTTQTATTEFSLSFSEDGKRYYVAMAVPACEGKLQVNDNGKMEYRDFGMDETNFMLEDKEVGDDPKFLKGEESNITRSEGGSSKETYSWNFTRGTMPPDLIVISPAYETWMPEAGEDEKTFGNTIRVGLVLQRKDEKPLDVKATEFIVQLLNTSREPGVTINYPPKTLIKGDYDMALMDEAFVVAPYFDGQKFNITSPDGKSGGFIIMALDGGAYTTLEVTAIMEDGSKIKGHYGKADGPTSIPYPFRDPGRKIAKAWLLANGNPREIDDLEVFPGSSSATEKGDGLSAYEEYRGVRSQNEFKRLSPAKHELGIRIAQENLPIFSKGIDLFAAATTITPVICFLNEMEDSRILNTNGMTHRFGSQYGLYLKTKNLGSVKGEILPASDFKTTRNSEEININATGIMKRYDSMANIKKLPYTEEEELNHTVAHYLCRGVSIRPHGASGKGEIFDPAGNPALKIQYLQEDGKPFPSIPKLSPHLVGGQANDASGDAGCIMCMYNKYEWVYIKNATGITYRKVPILLPGKKLCSSALGTKINSNGQYFGNAQSGRGNCVSQMKVKSW